MTDQQKEHVENRAGSPQQIGESPLGTCLLDETAHVDPHPLIEGECVRWKELFKAEAPRQPSADWISEATRQLCQAMLESSWGKSLRPSIVKQIITDSYERSVEVAMPETELLVDEAVEKWLNGPEEIDEFCDWFIQRVLRESRRG